MRLENWDWSAIFAGIAVLISLWALKVQREDIDRQNKYQRNTFELQNKIEENDLITNISAKLIGKIITQNENLYRWYIFKHEYQRYKRLFMEHQDDYEIGSGKYKDKIAIEELKNLKKEEIDNVANKDVVFTDNYYEMLSALEILLEGKENKKYIIKELNEIKNIFSSKSLDIAKLRFEGEKVPYNEIEDWRKKYQQKLDPRIKSLKLYFSSARKELIDKIDEIKKEQI